MLKLAQKIWISRLCVWHYFRDMDPLVFYFPMKEMGNVEIIVSCNIKRI